MWHHETLSCSRQNFLIFYCPRRIRAELGNLKPENNKGLDNYVLQKELSVYFNDIRVDENSSKDTLTRKAVGIAGVIVTVLAIFWKMRGTIKRLENRGMGQQAFLISQLPRHLGPQPQASQYAPTVCSYWGGTDRITHEDIEWDIDRNKAWIFSTIIMNRWTLCESTFLILEHVSAIEAMICEWLHLLSSFEAGCTLYFHLNVGSLLLFHSSASVDWGMVVSSLPTLVLCLMAFLEPGEYKFNC